MSTTRRTFPPWVAYVAPMATFLVLTSVEGYLPSVEGQPDPRYYPWAYSAKIACVVAVLVACRRTFRDLRPAPSPVGVALAVAVGIAVAAAWVGLDAYYPRFGTLGSRAGFDPNRLVPPGRWAFLAVRFLGLVLVVPLFEELFWRSFVVRWVADPDDFARVPIGRVTVPAALATAGLFALEHPMEWLPALLTGFAWAGLLRATRSVSACVLSHAVANFGLGLYVVWSHDWKFW